MKLTLPGITAVLLAVGVGVGVHQVARSTGQFRVPFIETEQPAEPDRPPLEIIAESTNFLARLAEAGQPASDEAAEQLETIDAAFDALQKNADAGEAEIRVARQSVLIARNAAAKIDRARFAESFLAFAEKLIEDIPDSTEAHQAEMLQLLVRHDLHRPAGRSFLNDVEQYAASHSSNEGATLYCLAAQELVRHQQEDAAKSLLRRGMNDYQSAPMAASMLVNQLADLGLSKAPPPKYTQAQFDAMMQSYEARAEQAVKSTESGKANCPPGRT